ncbi:hypothetical protein [Domibacillus tundrae]|nr:hypothetical protein [Domibacillus tundrae]
MRVWIKESHIWIGFLYCLPVLRIELIDEEHIGYWEQCGYEKDAW